MNDKLLNINSFKTLYSALLTKTKSLIVKPDWNQNDKNADNYIKNRTHYTEIINGVEIIHKIDKKFLPELGIKSWNDLENKPFYEETIEVTVLPETTLEFASAGYGGGINIGQEIQLIYGDTYKVIWDGVEYICECHSFSGDGVGDPGIFAGFTDDGFYAGAPFFIWESGMIIPKESGTHTFSITHVESNIHQLDEKFIPNNIKVKDWNQNDETSSTYIDNRTHYLISEGKVLFDDNITINSRVFNFPDYLPIEDGKEYAIYINDEVYYGEGYFESPDIWIDSEELDNNGITVYADSISFNKDSYNGQTIYFCLKERDIIKTLDKKYLPEDLIATPGRITSLENSFDSVKKTANNANSNVNSKMDKNNPTGTGSFSLNRSNQYEIGEYSFAAGIYAGASGYGSHAEASGKALGAYSHAEGGSTASGRTAHAEGTGTEASGTSSHAEGQETIASATASHAEGQFTIATRYCQHVQGIANIEDTEKKYLHIVGNGKMNSDKQIERSNAHTVDKNGNAWYSGDVYIKGSSQDDENAVKLATIVDVESSTQIDETELNNRLEEVFA